MSKAKQTLAETKRLIAARPPRQARAIRNRDEKPITGNRGGAGGRTFDQRLAAYRRSREQENPLRGLTLRRAIRLIQDYFRGDMAELQWTYFHIEGSDADMVALIELTLARLQEMDWDVLSNPKAEEKQAEKQKTFLRARFDAIDNLYEAIDHLAMARFRGYAHCEKWEKGGICHHLEIVDQWNVVRDGLKGAWKYNPDGRDTHFAALPDEAILPMERFVYREVARPVNRIALLKFIRAGLSEKDWDAFGEIYNIASGVVIGPPDVPEGKEAEYEGAAQKIAEGGSGYLPHGSTYHQNKAPTGSAPFKDRLSHLSEKLVLAGTGGKLTMLTDATGLGSGASEAHSKAFDSIASAEARRISEVINRDLVKPWLDAAFPGEAHLAYFRIAANEETDSSAIIEDVAKLSGAGFELDEAEVTERTGWTVKKKAPAPGAGMPNDQGPMPNGRPFANRAQGDEAASALRFAKAAELELSAADLQDLAPLLKRLAEIDAITDEAEWLDAMRRLDAEMPSIYAQVLAAGGKTEAFHRIYSTAFVDGLATGAEARSGEIKNKAVSRPARALAPSRARKGRK